MQIRYLPKQIYQLARLNDTPLSTQAEQRRLTLKAWVALRERGVTAKDAAETVEVSRATLFNWQKRFDRLGPRGLEPGSRRPKKLRAHARPPELIKEVEQLRNKYPAWGKAKLIILVQAIGWSTSESTVGRILSDLRAKGLIEAIPVNRYLPHKIRRSHRPHAVRRPKEMVPQKPGELIQLDTLQVVVHPGFAIKQFTSVDYVSRFSVAGIYEKATAANAARFLDVLVERMPFDVHALQIDGGSEFMAEFEQACKEKGITLFVLPPRSPTQNGRVERLNGTYRYEMYEAYDDLPDSIVALRHRIKLYDDVYNNIRPHQSLKGATPMQYLRQIQNAA